MISIALTIQRIIATSHCPNLFNTEFLKGLVSQWPYLVHHHPIAPHITLCGVLSVQNGLRSCPFDRNCTSFGFVVVVFIHVMRHAKVSNLYKLMLKVLALTVHVVQWFFAATPTVTQSYGSCVAHNCSLELHRTITNDGFIWILQQFQLQTCFSSFLWVIYQCDYKRSFKGFNNPCTFQLIRPSLVQETSYDSTCTLCKSLHFYYSSETSVDHT